MTIRLRCTACHRKLKVPDAALGKKVQCPLCGAKFIGRMESSPPPDETQTDTASVAVEEAGPSEMPIIDALFAEMGTSSPLSVEEIPAMRKTAAPPPNLELDQPPGKVESAGIESLEPEVLDAVDEADAVEVVNEAGAEEMEVTEEAESEEAEKKQPKKKKRRGLLCGCLAGMGFLMLLGCGVLGFFGYRYHYGSIAEGDWKPPSIPDARCIVLMPGEPMTTEERMPSGTRHRYTVEKPWAQSTFWLLYYDVPGTAGPDLLDARADEEAKIMAINLGTPETDRRTIVLSPNQGRELRFVNVGGNRTAILRIYAATIEGKTRVYEVFAEGPGLDVNSGVGAKFFNSFAIINPPKGAGGNPRMPPGPGVPPQPMPKR